MNARMFAALPLALAIGVLFGAPALAQDAMPASSASTMSHDGMQHKDAMKGSMHKHGMMMKKDAMHGGTMKHTGMQHTGMHHDAMTKKNDSMKMKKADSEPMASGG